jgi:hypothetical protein
MGDDKLIKAPYGRDKMIKCCDRDNYTVGIIGIISTLENFQKNFKFS